MEIGLTISPAATVNRRTDAATIGGTVTCSRAAQATVQGTLTQQIKCSPLSSGAFSTVVACSQAGSPWSATVKATSGSPFTTGPATVTVSASAPDAITANAGAVVQLTR